MFRAFFGMLSFFKQGNIFNSALSVEGGQSDLTEVIKSEISYLAEFGSGWSTFIELRRKRVRIKTMATQLRKEN